MKKYLKKYNIDYKRHLLLKSLSKNRTRNELRFDNEEKIGVSFEDIFTLLNCDKFELHGITSELYENDEILYTNVHHKGLYGKRNGISSFKNRKYAKRYEDLWLNLAKVFVGIFIPIISLLITLAVVLKEDTKEQLLQQNLQKLKKEIKYHKEESQKIHQYLEMKIDSLMTEKSKP